MEEIRNKPMVDYPLLIENGPKIEEEINNKTYSSGLNFQINNKTFPINKTMLTDKYPLNPVMLNIFC